MIVGCQFASWEFMEKNVEGFREIKETHQAALWLGGLESITDGLRDSKDLVLAGAKCSNPRYS